jgi:hypothetical protein
MAPPYALTTLDAPLLQGIYIGEGALVVVLIVVVIVLIIR